MANVTDNFNRANAANLGANWTPWIDALSRNKTPAILSNTASVQDDGNGDDAFTAYTGAAWTGGTDYYVEMQLTKGLNASGTMGGPMARCTFGNGANTSRGYLALPGALGISSAAHQLWRIDDNAVFTALGSPFTATIASTDVIRIEVQGTTIRFLVNGSVLQTAIDATYASGNPGLHLEFHSANDDTAADNWAAGDLIQPDTAIQPIPAQSSEVGQSLSRYASRARIAQNLSFHLPQDVSVVIVIPDTYAQPTQTASAISKRGDEYRARVKQLSPLIWSIPQDPQFIQPDSYIQPIAGQFAYGDSQRDLTNRALFASFLCWGGGGDIVASIVQHTYTQATQVSPMFAQRQFARNTAAQTPLLWNPDTSQSGPLAVQPDTFIQTVPGTGELARRLALLAGRTRFANSLLWNSPGDVSVATPQPDTYIQPIAGVGYVLRNLEERRSRARFANSLAWRPGVDLSTLFPQPDTYVQPIQGIGSLDARARERGYKARQQNVILWDTYPFASLPPPTAAPANLRLTPQIAELDLSWDAVPNAIFYYIYRGLHSGAEQLYDTSVNTFYQDFAVDKGINYFYFVTAVFVLQSGPSNEVYGVCLPGTSLEVGNNSIARERLHQEWYMCDRCGFWYPREKMFNQNGLNLCVGADTVNCGDKQGHSAKVVQLDIPYEQRPEPLPWEDIEL